MAIKSAGATHIARAAKAAAASERRNMVQHGGDNRVRRDRVGLGSVVFQFFCLLVSIGLLRNRGRREPDADDDDDEDFRRSR